MRYPVHVLDPHPVTAGLPATFEWTDEPYLAEVFAGEVVPLLRAGHDLAAADFSCAAAAVEGRDARCTPRAAHTGDDWIAGARTHRASRVVHVQHGDGASVFSDANFRRLLANALRWTTHEDL